MIRALRVLSASVLGAIAGTLLLGTIISCAAFVTWSFPGIEHIPYLLEVWRISMLLGVGIFNLLEFNG